MSKESISWLNTNTLIGCTGDLPEPDDRGWEAGHPR